MNNKIRSKFIKMKDSPNNSIYELNSTEDWYINLDDDGFGHKVEKVDKYPDLFIYGDTEDIIRKHEKEMLFYNRYPKLSDENKNVSCPNCGYNFYVDVYINNHDGYHEWCIDSGYVESIDCICGCNFRTFTEVTVKITAVVEE